MCLNEACSRVRVGKHLSDRFSSKNGLKQGDALSSLLFNFCLEYAVRRVQANHLKDPGVDVRIILKWIFERLDGGINWIDLVQNRDRWRAIVNTVMSLWVL